MKSLTRIRGIVTATSILTALPAAAQTPPVITEFSQGLVADSIPTGITTGPNGNLWFTAGDPGGIGQITPSGVITVFPRDPLSSFGASAIVAGPDGNLWFTPGAAIGRITPAGAVTLFTQGLNPQSNPLGIATGPDGNLWFTDSSTNPPAVGRITPTGTITEFSRGLNSGSAPTGITAGADGNLWFTDNGFAAGGGIGAIGRITPSGVITEFSQGLGEGPDFGPVADIVAGPDGNVWFTNTAEDANPTIGRITPAGIITEFSRGFSSGNNPQSITAGPDGNLWFTDDVKNEGEGSTPAIGRITPAGVITEFSLVPNSGSLLVTIATGPDGNLWFTDQGVTPAIGRVAIAAAIPTGLVASVLPGSRSVEVGNPATIFATMINTGATALDNCQVELPTSAAAGLTLDYQTTDPATNALAGTPETPATIAGNDGIQTFLLAFQATAAVSASGLALQFECDGSTPAALVPGVDTVDLSFSTTPVADIIALAATATNNGTIALPDGGAGAFAVASFNVGATATLTVSADTGGATLPLTATICQSNPANGQCLATPAATVSLDYAGGAAPTFSVFLEASGPIAFAPGASRVFVRFEDAAGGLHGSTSVAVETE